MGDRASYAIRENGRVELFYSQFGATTLLADIFWGPEEAEAAIRAQEAASTWLDDVYGEAAVALCKDTRSVAFYDCRYSPDARETAAQMMAALWPGWTARSVTYVSGVAATLGVDLAPAPPTTGVAEPTDYRPLDPTYDDGGVQLPATIWLETIDGGVRSVRLCDRHVGELLACGPVLVSALKHFSPLAEARSCAASLTTSGGGPVTLLAQESYNPPSLVRIDFDKKAVTVTLLPGMTALQSKSAVSRASLAWSGWSFACSVADPETFFGADPVPADLLPRVEPKPMRERLEELAESLLGAEVFKLHAARWLAGVSAATGIENLTPPPAGTIEQADRLERFGRALQSLGVPEAERSSIGESAARSAERGVSTRPDLELGALPGFGLVAYSEIEHDGRSFAAYQPRGKDMQKVGAPKLLMWTDRTAPPVEICDLRAEPMEGMYVRLHVAPSGRWLVAVVEARSHGYEVISVDLETRRAKALGHSGPRAELSTLSRVSCSEDDIRFTIDVRDPRVGRYGQGVVVVLDRRRGPIGEVPGRCLGRFVNGRLETSRATSGADGYRFHAAISEGLLLDTEPSARARLSGEAEPTFRERIHGLFLSEQWERLASECEAALRSGGPEAITYDYLSAAYLGLGDLTRAVEASERSVELAPYYAAGQHQLARVLAATGDCERAARAAERARDANLRGAHEVYLDPALSLLHGHPAFRALDYERLLHEASALRDPAAALAKLRLAIELDPKQEAAHRRLVHLVKGEDQERALAAWCAAAPDSFDANVARAASLADRHRPEAEPALRAMMARWPDAFDPPLHLARVALAAGRRAEALELLRTSREKHAVGDGEYDFESEVEQYEDLVELLPDTAD